MLDPQMPSHKLVLRFDVVVERDIWEGPFNVWPVGGRCRLAVPEERKNDDKVLVRVEGFIGANEPFVCCDRAGVPRRNL